MLQKKMLQIPVLRNAISCVLRGAFLVNKYQGKYNIYISSVTGRVQCTGKGGETVTL